MGVHVVIVLMAVYALKVSSRCDCINRLPEFGPRSDCNGTVVTWEILDYICTLQRVCSGSQQTQVFRRSLGCSDIGDGWLFTHTGKMQESGSIY